MMTFDGSGPISEWEGFLASDCDVSSSGIRLLRVLQRGLYEEDVMPVNSEMLQELTDEFQVRINLEQDSCHQ